IYYYGTTTPELPLKFTAFPSIRVEPSDDRQCPSKNPLVVSSVAGMDSYADYAAARDDIAYLIDGATPNDYDEDGYCAYDDYLNQYIYLTNGMIHKIMHPVNDYHNYM